MKILVCVKQVPDLEQITVTEGAEGQAVLDECTEFRMNRFDEFAVEEAIRIREVLASEMPVRIEALTAGPQRAAEVIKRAMGMGADQGIHLKTATDNYLCPGSVADAIAKYAAGKDYALILAGSISEDGMHGQVGPLVAGHLKVPCAAHAVRMQLTESRDAIYVEREIEGGSREKLRLNLSAVITVQSGINRPRYPSLSNLLRANQQELETIDFESLAGKITNSGFMGEAFPIRSRSGKRLTGTSAEKAQALLTLLKERAFIP